MRSHRVLTFSLRAHLPVPALVLVLAVCALASALAFAPAARAASGDLVWQYVSGAYLNQWDEFYDAVPGPNWTMYACGAMNDDSDSRGSLATACFQLVPDGRRGPLVWLRVWDNPAYDDRDLGRAITADPAGNAIVVGTTTVAPGNVDWAVVKSGPAGNLLWAATWGSPDGAPDRPTDVACDGAGNVYVCGYTEYFTGDKEHDLWIVAKFQAADGKLLWSRTFHGPRGVLTDQWATAIAVDTRGNSYITGVSGSRTSSSDMLVMKLTPRGKLAWRQRVDDPVHGLDWGEGIALYKNSVIAAGTYQTYGFMAARFTRAGERLWVKSWSAGRQGRADVEDMGVDESGAVTVCGSAMSYEPDRAVLVKWTLSGKRSWVRTWADPAGQPATFTSVVVDPAGTIWAAGDTGGPYDAKSDGIVARYQPTGTPDWLRTYAGAGGGADGFTAVRLWGLESLFVVGVSSTPTGYQELLATRYKR